MKNKVLFLLGDGVYPFVTGGMEVFNYYFIKALRDKMDVRYLAHKELNYDGVTCHKYPSIRPTKFTWPLTLFFHFLFHPKERNVLISFSAAHWIVWYLEYLIIKLFKLKATTVIHYGKTVPMEHPEAYRKFFAAQSAVVAVSHDIKKNYDATFGTDCKVIYPLVPFEKSNDSKVQLREKYNVTQDANIICMVGSIKGMKNPDTLIDAIANMTVEERLSYKPFALFAGGGPLISELQERAKTKEISQHVKFLGNVPKDDIKEIMALSDIFLIASDFEGTSVSLLEAMYNQKPIIISRAPGLVDMIEEGKDGWAFTTRDPKELKACIIDILENSDLADARSKSASNVYRQKYSFDQVIDEYMKLLN